MNSVPFDQIASNRERVDALLRSTFEWARLQEDVQAVALIGSWARGEPGPDSDVDILILTTTPSRYAETDAWAETLAALPPAPPRRWGVLVERRGMTSTGIEVDFGVASPSWASPDRRDPGSTRVINDGIRILYDPHGILERLVVGRRDGEGKLNP